MSTIVITGANKGLRREAARRLLSDGHDVWATARDPERGLATAEELGARHVVLDVTDDASVDPGYTATDLNFNTGTQTVSAGTDAIVSMATVEPDGPTGAFVSRDDSVAW